MDWYEGISFVFGRVLDRLSGLLQTRHVDLSSLIIIIIIIIIIITVIILDARGPHVSRRATYTNTCSLVCWLAEFTDLL